MVVPLNRLTYSVKLKFLEDNLTASEYELFAIRIMSPHFVQQTTAHLNDVLIFFSKLLYL
jgi:hypothetical protein